MNPVDYTPTTSIEYIKAAMATEQISEAELADFIGTTYRTVHRWVKREVGLPLELLPQICKVIGIIHRNQIDAMLTLVAWETMTSEQRALVDHDAFDRLLDCLATIVS